MKNKIVSKSFLASLLFTTFNAKAEISTIDSFKGHSIAAGYIYCDVNSAAPGIIGKEVHLESFTQASAYAADNSSISDLCTTMRGPYQRQLSNALDAIPNCAKKHQMFETYITVYVCGEKPPEGTSPEDMSDLQKRLVDIKAAHDRLFDETKISRIEEQVRNWIQNPGDAWERSDLGKTVSDPKRGDIGRTICNWFGC